MQRLDVQQPRKVVVFSPDALSVEHGGVVNMGQKGIRVLVAATNI